MKEKRLQKIKNFSRHPTARTSLGCPLFFFSFIFLPTMERLNLAVE
jgi:hypothetical protein